MANATTVEMTVTTAMPSAENGSYFQMPDYGPIEIVIPIVFGCNCLMGIIGNSLVIYVILKHSKMKTVANIYILSLAIADLFFMLSIPFIAVHNAAVHWPFGYAWCKLITAVDGLNQSTGIYCLTAMSVDRYLAIVHPIRSMKVRTVRVATVVNVSIWFLAAVTVMPLWLYSKTIEHPTRTVCTLRLPYQGFKKVFYIYMFVFGLVGPVLIITVCYMLMIRRLYTGVAPLGSSNTKTPTKKVARMVLTVIFVFVSCWTPFYSLQLYSLTVPDDWIPSKGFVIGFYFTLCLSYFNSSINPVIYSFMSDNFRKCFSKVMRCKRLRDADIDADTRLNKNSGNSAGRDDGQTQSTALHKASTAPRPT
ncbi:somatostatin receptor type 2-like [Ptychodera flava]|uniref:somatostatin receptor type 2-like n=1 Tax=Ptychodera flava TaxID=63121 RepID=UPI003969DF84